jgi:hypothetical protein
MAELMIRVQRTSLEAFTLSVECFLSSFHCKNVSQRWGKEKGVQLLSMSSMHIMSKYEEYAPVDMNYLLSCSSIRYSKTHLLALEGVLLSSKDALDFDLGFLTINAAVLHFFSLPCFSSVSETKMVNMRRFGEILSFIYYAIPEVSVPGPLQREVAAGIVRYVLYVYDTRPTVETNTFWCSELAIASGVEVGDKLNTSTDEASKRHLSVSLIHSFPGQDGVTKSINSAMERLCSDLPTEEGIVSLFDLPLKNVSKICV